MLPWKFENKLDQRISDYFILFEIWALIEIGKYLKGRKISQKWLVQSY